MKVETLEDGTTIKHLRPMRGIPTYSDWLRLLLSRSAAHLISGRIVPLDRHQEQTHCLDSAGEVKITCLGCGELASKMDMARIRIGGLIQLPFEEQVSKTEIVRKFRVQPTSKSGLGCKACQGRMADAEQEITRQNTSRDDLATLRARLADARAQLEGVTLVAGAERCKHGMKQTFCAACHRNGAGGTTKAPSHLTAFIDVLEGWTDETADQD